MAINEPFAIDPYNVQESAGALVAENLFTELVTVAPDGRIKPGVADTWTPSDGCKQWTFTLKSGTKFHNGEVVDAAAFKRGWERVAAKSSNSDVAYHLAEVSGFDQMQAGTASELTGVTTPSASQLVVALSRPDCEFYTHTFHPVFSPIPQAAGAADNKIYNEQPIGNGPFMMDGPWRHNQSIRLKRFDDYAAGPQANLDAVDISVIPENVDEYQLFKQGKLDWALVKGTAAAEAHDTYEPQGQWRAKSEFSTTYLTPMVTTDPLKSTAARQAISMAIDRDAIRRDKFGDGKITADSLVPPALSATYQPGICSACHYDPQRAKQLAAQAGLVPGTGVELQTATGHGGVDGWAGVVAAQLQQNLGLTVKVSSADLAEQQQNERKPHATGLFPDSWYADYPTAENFLKPLLSTEAIGAGPDETVAGDNHGRYSNPQFDRILTDAAATRDDTQRSSLYKEAEKLAIGQDQALIPLWYDRDIGVANSKGFGNLDFDFTGNPTLADATVK